MLTKPLLTISLLLPLVAVSATAYACSTISDNELEANRCFKHEIIFSCGIIPPCRPLRRLLPYSMSCADRHAVRV